MFCSRLPVADGNMKALPFVCGCRSRILANRTGTGPFSLPSASEKEGDFRVIADGQRLGQFLLSVFAGKRREIRSGNCTCLVIPDRPLRLQNCAMMMTL